MGKAWGTANLELTLDLNRSVSAWCSNLLAVGIDEGEDEAMLHVGLCPGNLDLDRQRHRSRVGAADGPAAAQDEELAVDRLGRVGEKNRYLHDD